MRIFSFIIMVGLLLVYSVVQIFFCSYMLKIVSKGFIVLILSIVNFLLIALIIRYISKDSHKKH